MMAVADTHKDTATAAEHREGEPLLVYRHRYQAARDAGLTIVEAQLFADSTEDIGLLRVLAASDLEPAQIARIIL